MLLKCLQFFTMIPYLESKESRIEDFFAELEAGASAIGPHERPAIL
jgi:hypothetical protein